MSNPTLTSHKLLILTPWPPSPTFISNLQAKHPSLTILHRPIPSFSNTTFPPESYPHKSDWEDITILLTYKIIPPKEWVPRLQYVQLTSAGCNQIMESELFLGGGMEREVAFCTSNGVHPPQIAEWVFATFLSFQHHIPTYLDAMRENNWIDVDNDEDTEDAVGLRIGIMGYGCIGRQIGRIAQTLGMEVYAYTRTERPTPASRVDPSYHEPGMGDPEGLVPAKWFSGETTESVNEFVSSGLDLLVLAMPLTDSTRNMISLPQLSLLKSKKTYLSNIGRGGLINTPDLIHALEEGWIRGAALDVTEPEPLPADSKLWGMKNVIITPHVSGNSTRYNERLLKILGYNLGLLSEGKEVVNRVRRELGY